MVTGEDSIAQSLKTLFGTQPGERVLELDYGCDLSSLLFSNISLSQKTILEDRIQQAIILFEPRVNLEGVEVDTSQIQNGKVQIFIDYTIDQSNNRSNRVFPFFIQEGNLIPDF